MSLVNNSANNFKDFLDAIKPYLNYQFYDLSGQGVEANNFSTDEKVIGTWIDGKPLYQKTTILEGPYKGSVNGLSIGIENKNVDEICYLTCLAQDSSSGSYMNIPYVNQASQSDNSGFAINSQTFLVALRFGQSNISNLKFLIRYTKTTDSAVSSGEKIVGQWIDGKPVFEKVFEKTLNNVNYDTNYDFDISDLSIDGIIKIDILSSLNNLWESESACWMNSNSVLRARQKWTNNGGTVTVRITLRYTKTT